MSSPRLRHSVRAIVLDEDDRVLLCRCVITEPEQMIVWAAPGGGIEDGEAPLDALRRELREEIGLTLAEDPPHVWHQRVLGREYMPGYDGVVNDYFMVRTASFEPRGAMSDDELATENISGMRWWRPEDIAAYRGPDLFGPRDLASPLTALLAGGAPAEPIVL